MKIIKEENNMNNLAYDGFIKYCQLNSYTYKTMTKHSKMLSRGVKSVVSFNKNTNEISIDMTCDSISFVASHRVISAPDTNIIERYNIVVDEAVQKAYEQIVKAVYGFSL